jgi:hypothetical protein
MQRLAIWLLTAIVFSIATLVTAVFVWPQEPAEDLRIPCRAQYIPLTPYEMLGMDECGHVWKLILPRDVRPHPENPNDVMITFMGQNETPAPICVFWDLESGMFRVFQCPEPGEVTGYLEGERELR